MPLTIMIDIDGVLNTLDETVLDVYNEDSGDHLRPEDITEYHIEKFVLPEYRENFYKYFLDKRVWQRIKIVDGCQTIIQKLWNEGYKIIFVTKTECENLVKKRNWLNRTFPFIGEDNMRKMLYSCPVKQYIRADIAIDDGLFNLIGDRTYFSICLDKPYNQTNDQVIDNFYRAHNWNEIYSFIKIIDHFQKTTELMNRRLQDDILS